MAIVVLDPGHGGASKVGGSSPNNAVGPTGLLEKTVTLDVGLRAEALLKAAGHTVLMTRKVDKNSGLAARAKVAKDAKAPVFVSIHLNGFDGKVQRTETWLHSDHTGASKALATAVQKTLVKATGLKDGKVQAKGLGVLSPAAHAPNTACCLVEISFMDVPAEEKRLKTEAYRQTIAEGICEGILAYLASASLELAMTEAVFEDGFAGAPGANALIVGAVLESVAAPAARGRGKKAAAKSKTAAPKAARAKDARDEGTFDRNEFAIVDIGPPYDAGRAAREGVLETLASFDMAKFEAFVAGLKLRHIGAAELLYMGGSNSGTGPCAGTNSLPPELLWKNIAKTAQMLDEIRERLGSEVRIHSAYRNKPYNSCIGGEPKSYHSKFMAIDFSCAKGMAADWHKVATQVRASSKTFEGGIGKYNTFVHIDTRGYRADW